MTVRVRKADMAVNAYDLSVTWDSSAADFVNEDVLDIQASLMKPAGNTTVVVSGSSSCTVRINSMSKRYPLLATAKSLGYPAPDLQTEKVYLNPNALEYSVAAGQTLEIDDMPVSNIEFTALAGTVVVTAR